MFLGKSSTIVTRSSIFISPTAYWSTMTDDDKIRRSATIVDDRRRSSTIDRRLLTLKNRRFIDDLSTMATYSRRSSLIVDDRRRSSTIIYRRRSSTIDKNRMSLTLIVDDRRRSALLRPLGSIAVICCVCRYNFQISEQTVLFIADRRQLPIFGSCLFYLSPIVDDHRRSSTIVDYRRFLAPPVR